MHKLVIDMSDNIIAEKIAVVGVSFKNEDGSDRQEILSGLLDDIQSGDIEDITVMIKHEKDNQFDENAVCVAINCNSSCGKVGYIPKEESERICRLLHNEKIKTINICSIGRASGNGNIGMELEFLFEKSNF